MYHFSNRTLFLKQAHRVLKVGGKIGVTDIVLTSSPSVWMHFLSWILRIPFHNWTTLKEYTRTLEEIGFQCQIECIESQVFPGLTRFILDRHQWLKHVTNHQWLGLVWFARLLKYAHDHGWIQFILIVAVKVKN